MTTAIANPPTGWIPSNEERYHEMLGAVPPEYQSGASFLLGEPQTHRRCEVLGRSQAAFDGFTVLGGQYLQTKEPKTLKEFEALLETTLIQRKP